MAKIIVKRAHFCHYVGSISSYDEPLDSVEKKFSRCIGEHITETLKGLDITALGVYRHHICSTIIDIPFSSKKFSWPRIRTEISKYTDNAPQSFLNAYECAGWGYSLRYALQNQKESRHVLLTIVDMNLLNLEYWEENPNWGHSGFGITTLLLECLPNAEEELTVGVAQSKNAVAEFTFAMRKKISAEPELKLAYPFFPTQVIELFRRQIPDADFLPDLHPEFGHCFGADPWISIIRDQCECIHPQSYLAASVALNGYWALAEITVENSSSVSLSRIQL